MRSSGLGLAVSVLVLHIAVPAHAQQRCAPYTQAIELIERTCLSNVSTSAGIKVQGALDIIKRAVSGDASLTAERVRGARRDLDDALQLPENNAIRECMRDYQKRMLDCIDEEIRLKTDAFPDSLDLQFSLSMSGGRVEFLFDDRVVLGVKSPPRHRPEQHLVRDASGLFVEDITAPRAGRAFHAFVRRAVREGFVPSTPVPMTEICLERHTNPPQSGNLFTRLVCKEGAPCDKFDPLDPGWLSGCIRRSDIAVPAAKGWASLLIARAHAQAAGLPLAAQPSWYVPSLATLESRSEREFAGVGYTEFEIVARMPPGIDADGISLDLKVNDTPVLIDGLPGELRTQRIASDGMLLKGVKGPGTYLGAAVAPYLNLKFALQTLDFDGRHGGCDLIHATLRLYREGERVGPEFHLTRPYVALRDPEPVQTVAEGTTFLWTGAYRRPKVVNEHQVFVNSLQAASWNDGEAMARARTQAHRLQEGLNAVGLTFQGRPIVGVVRPGLTQPSYGLALGLVQPSQQVQFTFPSATAAALKEHILRQRNDRSDVRAVTSADAFIYKLGRDVPPPNVCNHLRS